MAKALREVVIVGAVRTAVGRGHPEKGIYRNIHPNTLLGTCFTGLLERTGVDPTVIDSVIGGCVQQYGEQGLNAARNAWLEAGLPVETAATTIDHQCGSAQQAINFAAALIASGAHEVIIAGGVEHMGHLPIGIGARFEDIIGVAWTPELLGRYPVVNQGVSAEMIAERWDIGRRELDELALRSHRLAAQATQEGRFGREIVPVEADGVQHRSDQGIRPDTTIEQLAELKPVFLEGGVITAGNSSQVSDGASAVLLTTPEKAAELELRPRARIVETANIGVDPVLMLTGPIPATRRVLDRAGMEIGDIDLIEVNEAFASVVAAWAREIRPDMERVNVNGGAIALGHPLGSTGARLVTTLLHALERTDREYGLVTMCCGGGLGTATIIQRV